MASVEPCRPLSGAASGLKNILILQVAEAEKFPMDYAKPALRLC